MKKTLIISLLILIAQFSFGQQLTDLYGDYLGQTPPGDTPVVFAPGIISKSSLEHSAAIFSSDGNEVYWCSHEFPLNRNKAKLWFMTRINNRWTKPEILTPFGDSNRWIKPEFSPPFVDSLQISCVNPFLSIDGKRLYFFVVYFGVNRNKVIKNGVSPSLSIGYINSESFVIEKQDNGWSKPQSVNLVTNIADSHPDQLTFTSDGTVYFIAGHGPSINNTTSIFKSKLKNGNYLPADSLPACINSPSLDWTPYIARDDSYLIFSSNRHNSNDAGDLYISFHDINADIWSEPINMGEPINTWAQERFPTVSPDGKYLFFTRWTENNHMDIFWVSAKIIDRLREKNKMKY